MDRSSSTLLGPVRPPRRPAREAHVVGAQDAVVVDKHDDVSQDDPTSATADMEAVMKDVLPAPRTAPNGPKDGVLRGPPLTAPLDDDSLGLVLLRSMRQHGERTALVDAVTGESMTYRDLVRESVCLARALRVLLKDIEEEDAGGGTRHTGGRGKEKDAGRNKNENETLEAGKDEKFSSGDLGKSSDVVVGVFVENRKELVPSLVANLMLGVPVTMLNPLSNTGELVRAWTATRPSVSLCSWGTLSAVLEASRSLPSLRHVVVFPSDVTEDMMEAVGAMDVPWTLHVVFYADLLSRVVVVPDLDRDTHLDHLVEDVAQKLNTEEHVAYLLQCGRGGRFARLTHRNLIYTVQLLQQPDAGGYGWTRDDVLLLGAPLSHAFGLGICLGALALGLKVVVMPYFREQLFLSAVQHHKVSQLVLVPQQALRLAHSPLLEDAVVLEGLRGFRRGLAGARGLRGLRGVVCAAAPLPRALHRDLTRRLAAPCRQAYGLTQAACSLLVAPRGAPPDTQGRVVPGAEAKVVDVSGGMPVPLGPLQVGELLLRAPSIMAGYLGEDVVRGDALDATPAQPGTEAPDVVSLNGVDADGWLHTGDLAYYDHNGFVFVVDRLKDVTLYTRGHFKEFDGEHGAGEEL